MKTEYIVGSNAFFAGMEGFSPKDNDRLILVDDASECGLPIITHSEMRLKGNCYFFYKRLPKDEMINNCIKSKDPIVVGKFLVPSVARDLGLTIDDLRRLEDTVSSLDEAHTYEGAKGIEVGSLVRRLKATLNNQDINFILTSATLVS